MDLNSPYDFLELMYPGKFRLEDRLRPRDTPPPRENFNLSDAAEYLGISQRHLKDLCLEKRIIFSKPHYRAYSFRREDLDRWLEQYRMRARSAF
jgi:excisionase family DNA binding protein